MFYFLYSNKTLLKDLGTGTTFKELSSVSIPVPPLTEQKRIVALLDKAFVAIDQARVNMGWNLVNYEKLFQSKLDSVFSLAKGAEERRGWVERKLWEVCSSFQYGTSSKSDLTGDVPVIRMGNIQNMGIDWDDLK